MDNSKELEFKEKFNLLPNLQLLQGTKNNQKDSKPFKEWLDTHCSTEAELERFCKDNYIPQNCSLEIDNFLTLFEARRLLMKKELMKVLKVTHSELSKS